MDLIQVPEKKPTEELPDVTETVVVLPIAITEKEKEASKPEASEAKSTEEYTVESPITPTAKASN